MRASPAGRTPELADDRPEKRRAPTQGQTAVLSLTLLAPTCYSWTSAVTCGKSCQWYNGLGLGMSLLDATRVVSSTPIFLFRASPSLSSSVYLLSSHPFTTPQSVNTRGKVDYRNPSVEGIIYIPSCDRASRVRGSVPHRFPVHFPRSPSFQMSCSMNEAEEQVPLMSLEVRVPRLWPSRHPHANGRPRHRLLKDYSSSLSCHWRGSVMQADVQAGE